MFKRVFSLFLVTLMLLALVACGDTEPTTDSGSVENPGSSITEKDPTGSTDCIIGPPPGWEGIDPNYDDFAGKNYIIIQHQDEFTPFGYGQDSLNAEKALERVAEVEAMFSCTLAFDTVPYDDNFASSMQGKLYAENAGDLVFSTNNAQLRKALGRGGEESVMQDLLALDNILNFWNTEKWGNITSRETMMAGGTFYGLTPALWYEYTPLPYYIMAYNKDILGTMGLTDPQEIWEKEEWDRDNMLDLITSCYDDSGADPIWGLSATMTHMVRAAYLSSGVPAVVINKIKHDGSVDWSYGISSPDALESLQWLKNSITTNRKYFNNGKDNASDTAWGSHNSFTAGQALFCLTAPSVIFNNIAMNMDAFGLIPWAGVDANMMTGYYENCASVAIPIFAQSVYQSAFLAREIFEGLDGVETKNDVISYYRETYFDSDLDVTFLLMDGAALQYSYWPNGGDLALNSIASALMGSSSVKTLVEKHQDLTKDTVEDHIAPNAVKLEQYRQNGFFY